jgi:hypothetical protein
MKTELDPDGNVIQRDTSQSRTYNEEKTDRARKAGAIVSADDLPLAKRGTEGNWLGAEARPAAPHLGDFDPAVGKSAPEYKAPPSSLPMTVNPLDGYRKLPGSGGGY